MGVPVEEAKLWRLQNEQSMSRDQFGSWHQRKDGSSSIRLPDTISMGVVTIFSTAGTLVNPIRILSSLRLCGLHCCDIL
jgi:hypothetical protein